MKNRWKRQAESHTPYDENDGEVHDAVRTLVVESGGRHKEVPVNGGNQESEGRRGRQEGGRKRERRACLLAVYPRESVRHRLGSERQTEHALTEVRQRNAHHEVKRRSAQLPVANYQVDDEAVQDDAHGDYRHQKARNDRTVDPI